MKVRFENTMLEKDKKEKITMNKIDSRYVQQIVQIICKWRAGIKNSGHQNVMYSPDESL